VNARPILIFVVALLAGFAGVFVFLQGSERGADPVAPTATHTHPTNGSALTQVEPPRQAVVNPSTPEVVQLTPVETDKEPLTEDELDMKELGKFRAHVEVGRIAGIALVGRGPAVQTPVHVWEEARSTASDGALTPPPGAWSTTTTSDGVFEFKGFQPGRYRVLVEWGEARKEIPCEIKKGIGSKRIVCVFGSGAITGRVLNPDGAPLIGARVSASELGPWIGGNGRISHVLTGADGRYHLDGLVAGRYWVTAKHMQLPGGSLDDNPQVRLAAGKTYELDLGRAISGIWNGTLRDADGHPIEGPRLMSLRETTSGLERRFLSDPSGTFREALPQGTYEVSVGFQNQIHIVAGTVAMVGVDLQQDMHCATRPVIFQPTCLDCSMSDRQVAVEVAKEMSLVVGEKSFKAEIPRASGELRFYGLPDGEYTLEVGDAFGVDIGGEPVSVSAEDAFVPRRLTLFRQ